MNINSEAAQKLFEGGHLSEKQYADIQEYHSRNIFSLNLELRSLLYAGILGITSGLGVLVYKNIDTIGHLAVITFIGLACACCFAWCFKNGGGYSNQQVVNDNPFFDYVLLAACLLAGVFTAYIQYAYNVFGDHYGLATLAPTLLYLFCAYYFDHRGVLSLGITGIGAWLGISVAPTGLIQNGLSYTPAFDYTAVGLGFALLANALYAKQENIKTHFNFTYLNFAMHLIFIGSLAGLFAESYGLVYVLPIAIAALYFNRLAHRMSSFNFFLFTVLYAYITISYLFVKTSEATGTYEFIIIISPLYFMASSAGIIYWAINFKKRIKA